MRVRAQWNCVKRSLKIDRSVINAVTNSSYTLLGGWASDLAHPSTVLFVESQYKYCTDSLDVRHFEFHCIIISIKFV